MLKNQLRVGEGLICSICWCQWYKYHGPIQATNVKSAGWQNSWKFNKWLWADSGTPLGFLTYSSAGCLHVVTKLHQGTQWPGSPCLVPNLVWAAELAWQDQVLWELARTHGCFIRTANQLDWNLRFISHSSCFYSKDVQTLLLHS